MNHKEFKKYSTPLGLTSQFKMCGNPFRLDIYRGCSFGCKYCFANNRADWFKKNFAVADIASLRRLFVKAIDNGDASNLAKEMLNHRVPIHLGGMSDPFQHIEFELHQTLEFLKLSAEYNYPVNISTKTAHLTDEYWDVLNPDIHTFSISWMGWDDDYLNHFESNTPPAISD